MDIETMTTGIQHVGIPTNDIEKTIAFYSGLGFKTILCTVNEVSGEPVAFLKLKNLVIETYQNDKVIGQPGAIDHIAIDVTDIDAAYSAVNASGYRMLDDSVRFLPFWSKGTRFFTILGPNGEKVEFSQIL